MTQISAWCCFDASLLSEAGNTILLDYINLHDLAASVDVCGVLAAIIILSLAYPVEMVRRALPFSKFALP